MDGEGCIIDMKKREVQTERQTDTQKTDRNIQKDGRTYRKTDRGQTHSNIGSA